MYSITLFIDNQSKTFTQPFVSGRILRRTFEVQEQMNKLLEESGGDLAKVNRVKEMELAADYVCEVFGNQFTRDQYIDGVASHKFFEEYWRIRELVELGRNEAFGIEPANEAEDTDPNA
jgi:hypothetical protein